MENREPTVAMIGFGEAAAAFAMPVARRAYDRKTDDRATRSAKYADYARAGVAGHATLADAVAGAAIVFSLVTADQAEAVATVVARHLIPGARYYDGNSVAPAIKRAAAAAIEAKGGDYVDMAIMAPVDPAALAAPILLSGARAASAADSLRALGFGNVRVVGGEAGHAASIKMIRSVVVKGIEALTAEMALAANAAGVLEDVIASLDASDRPMRWADRVDYNLERMTRHGLRRAAEMEQVTATLDALGTGSAMARATAACQRVMGEAGATSAEPYRRRA